MSKQLPGWRSRMDPSPFLHRLGRGSRRRCQTQLFRRGSRALARRRIDIEVRQTGAPLARGRTDRNTEPPRSPLPATTQSRNRGPEILAAYRKGRSAHPGGALRRRCGSSGRDTDRIVGLALMFAGGGQLPSRAFQLPSQNPPFPDCPHRERVFSRRSCCGTRPPAAFLAGGSGAKVWSLALPGLDPATTGLRLSSPARTTPRARSCGGLRIRAFLAEQESLARPSFAALRPLWVRAGRPGAGRSPSRPRWRGPDTAAEEITMAQIGTFTRGEDGFVGVIKTLSLNEGAVCPGRKG